MDEIKTGVGVLDKVMTILRTFMDGDNVLSPLEIAAHTDLPLATVYRLTQALSEHGMLEKDGQRFRLGITLMHLGALVTERLDLSWQALPHLRWLNEQTGENAELHIRNAETRIVVETVRSSQSLRPFVAIGAPLPLHLGAAGKVLLAWLSEQGKNRLAQASAERFPGEQPFDLHTLQEQLEQIRNAGWAASIAERAPGVAAIAAPIFNAQYEVVGAMTLTAPSIRLTTKQRQAFAPLVQEAATRVSHDLGFIEGTDRLRRGGGGG